MSHTAAAGLAITGYRRATGDTPEVLILSLEFYSAVAAENLFGSALVHGRLWDIPYTVASHPDGDWIEARSQHEITDQGDTDIVCYRRMRVPGPTD